MPEFGGFLKGIWGIFGGNLEDIWRNFRGNLEEIRRRLGGKNLVFKILIFNILIFKTPLYIFNGFQRLPEAEPKILLLPVLPGHFPRKFPGKLPEHVPDIYCGLVSNCPPKSSEKPTI